MFWILSDDTDDGKDDDNDDDDEKQTNKMWKQTNQHSNCT